MEDLWIIKDRTITIITHTITEATIPGIMVAITAAIMGTTESGTIIMDR